jgi:hypothetical protein
VPAVCILERCCHRSCCFITCPDANRSLLLLLLLLQAAATELARLEASRARVVLRVHTLEGQLGRLVDEEATLLEQRTEGEATAVLSLLF